MYIKELQAEKLKQIREITNVQKKLNFRSKRLKKDVTMAEEIENKWYVSREFYSKMIPTRALILDDFTIFFCTNNFLSTPNT